MFPDTTIPGQSLFVASMVWDGTSNPYDYYYTDANNSSFPVPSAAPGEIGLSSDGGTFNFALPDPGDGTWNDIGNDTLSTVIETRFAYMINPFPAPDTVIISGNFDVAGGVWGDSYDQENGDSFPFEDGTWASPPSTPLGSPNNITSPVWPSLTFMEAIAGAAVTAQRFDVKIT